MTKIKILFFTDDHGGRMHEEGPFESIRYEPGNKRSRFGRLVVPPMGDTAARFLDGKWYVTGCDVPFTHFEIYLTD